MDKKIDADILEYARALAKFHTAKRNGVVGDDGDLTKMHDKLFGSKRFKNANKIDVLGHKIPFEIFSAIIYVIKTEYDGKV